MTASLKQDGKLLALTDLAELIGIGHALLHKAAVRNLFPYMRTPGGMRLVSADDEQTLELLTRAVAIYRDPELGLSFDKSLRLANRGFSPERACAGQLS